MRTFEIGNKVKFLNQTGGGVVIAVLSPTMVTVRTEDGFELPTLCNELVLVADDKASKMFSQSINVDTSDIVVPNQAGVVSTSDCLEETIITPLRTLRGKNEQESGVYIAMVPQDQNMLIAGDLDVYLINHTHYDVLYSIYLENESSEFLGKDYGSVYAESKVWLDTISREDINRWLHGIIQLMFFHEKALPVFRPHCGEYRIRGSRFYKTDVYQRDPLLGVKAIENKIISQKEMEVFADNINLMLKEEDRSCKKEEKKQWFDEDSVLNKHMKSRTEAEIDLHIDELVEDSTGMQPIHMLKTQMSYFRRCLSEAINQHLEKLIVIHGVGMGVLKQEIEKEISQYKGIHSFPASMQKYGVGAVEILLGNEVTLRK